MFEAATGFDPGRLGGALLAAPFGVCSLPFTPHVCGAHVFLLENYERVVLTTHLSAQLKSIVVSWAEKVSSENFVVWH